jgi:hypothetical protein
MKIFFDDFSQEFVKETFLEIYDGEFGNEFYF